MVVEPGSGFAGHKHQRTAFGSSPHAKRPIDKSLVAVQLTGINATDQSTTLLAVTFPCTMVGLRWSFTATQDAGTSTSFHHWAIVRNPDGVVLGTLAISDAAAFFEPEQNCLVFGAGTIPNNVDSTHYEGSTKTMRKLFVGDKLEFIVKGSATNTCRVDGVIQFFCKT